MVAHVPEAPRLDHGGLEDTPRGFGLAASHVASRFCKTRRRTGLSWVYKREPEGISMLTQTRRGVMVVIGSVAAGLALGDLAGQQAPRVSTGETSMRARGSFDVQLTPTPTADSAGGPIGHLVLAKQFYGDLQGSSRARCWVRRPQSKAPAPTSLLSW